MSIGNLPGTVATEAAMLAALAGILNRGAFVTDDLDAIVAAESDITTDAGTRCFARLSIEWLARQSGRRDLRACGQDFDVRH